MESPQLKGRTVLILDDEPLVALDIARELEKAGASVVTANNLRAALKCIDEHSVSAAVIDCSLTEQDSATLYGRFKERLIPFIRYSGSPPGDQARVDAPFLSKPASRGELTRAIAGLLAANMVDL
jgi:DNA-binding NtrC family response regulator